MGSEKICNLFGGKDAVSQNVLMTALIQCSKDDDREVYAFLEQTPKTTLVVLLTDKIRELGYDIKPLL